MLKIKKMSLLLSQQKAKNEELTQLAEQRKNDTERKKKEAEEKEREAVRRQYERERQARVDEVSSLTQGNIVIIIKILENNYLIFFN